MKPKYIFGGAMATVLLALGFLLYRQIRKAFGIISFAFSRNNIDAYIA
jgi:hypothetical protein